MNKKNLELCIEALERSLYCSHEYEFSMRHYAHPCGAPACVLGHLAAATDLQDAFALREGVLFSNSRECSISHMDPAIQKFFDIEREQAEELFSSDGCGGATTKQQAIEYLEMFIRDNEDTNAV